MNMTSWFAIASAEIRTRRILREKAGCKQSNNYSRTSANGHLYTTATLFCPGRQSIHWLLFKPLYNGHLLLSPRWPLWRGSTVLGFISLMPSPPFFPERLARRAQLKVTPSMNGQVPDLSPVLRLLPWRKRKKRWLNGANRGLERQKQKLKVLSLFFLNDNTALLELTENMSIQSHSELNFG